MSQTDYFEMTHFLTITSLVRSIFSPLMPVGEPVSSSGHAAIFWQI